MSFTHLTSSERNSPSHFAVPSNLNPLSADLLSDIDSDYEYEFDYTQSTSSLMSNNSQSGSRTLVGRKKNEFTLILEKFYTKNSKNPKKEFINAFIIRSIRRFFRNASTNKKPIKTCLAINESNDIQKESWITVKKMYLADPGYFNRISLTTSAPLTDGKAKRKDRNLGRVAKSHNNEFCKNFFVDKRMQKAFYVLMDLLFSDPDPSQLKLRFQFYCCVDLSHFEDCYNKWNELKNYFYNKYLKDLDLTIDEDLVKLALKSERIEPRLDDIKVIGDTSFLGDLEDFIL